MRSQGASPFRHWSVLASLLLILVATLIPLGPDPPHFEWGIGLADGLVNLALFLPLGAALRGIRPGRVVLTALLLSGGIELLQGSVLPGRRGSMADVAANVIGAATGTVVLRAPVALLALPLAAWLASGPALAPAPPRTPRWWGQWAHHFGGTLPFRGRILGVRLLGRAAGDGSLDSTGALVAEARRNGLALEVSLLSGGTTGGLTHLAGIADGQGHAVVVLEQSGDDLRLAWWSRGAAAGLRSPAVVIPAALPSGPGRPVTITAVVRREGATVEISRPGGTIRRSLRFTPMAGWRNFLALPASFTRWPRVAPVLWAASALGYAAALALLAARRRRAPVS